MNPAISPDFGDSLARSVAHHVFRTMIPPILPTLHPTGSLGLPREPRRKWVVEHDHTGKHFFTSIHPTHLCLHRTSWLQAWTPSTAARVLANSSPFFVSSANYFSNQAGFDIGFGLCAFVRHNPFGSNLDCLWITFKLLLTDDLAPLLPQQQVWDPNFPHPFSASPTLLHE